MSEIPSSRFNFTQTFENGRAQRRVDHRHRLVGQEDARVEQQRARHHDALALTAAQLMRIAAERLLRAQPGQPQAFVDAAVAPLLASVASPNLRTGVVSV